jgi:uncharacterized membrane protein HdeD (DUF308 family)
MPVHDTAPGSAAGSPTSPRARARLLLGIAIMLAGGLILADIAFAAGISSAFIGAAAIIVGILEVVHAASTTASGGRAWQMLLGLLYIALGLLLVGGVEGGTMLAKPGLARSARQGELLLTYGLGLLLVLSGIVRVLLGSARWTEFGWPMLVSGAFGVVAGLVVLSEFPKTGLWIFGLLLGLDLVAQGAAWLGYPLPRKSRSV